MTITPGREPSQAVAPGTLGQHRDVLATAQAVLEIAGTALYQADNHDLGALLHQIDTLAATAAGLRCEVVLESRRRGLIADAGMTTREWVVEYAPSLRQAGAAQLATLVDRVCARTGLAAGDRHDELTNTGSPVAMIWARTITGEIAPPLALGALSEMDRLHDRLVPAAVPTVTTALLDIGAAHGRASMSEVRIRLLADHGLPDELNHEHDRLRPHAYLSAPQVDSGNLTTYTMGLTPEQAVILEAALGPLSAPQPNDDTGERDLRPQGQRRAEALTELATRAAAADADTRGGPHESTTCVYVTVPLATLKAANTTAIGAGTGSTAGAGAGEVLGSTATGTRLSPETLRAMSCDATVIPTVLGSQSQPLDYGRAERLFTRAQRRAIWHRDKTCTYPGCHNPGAWSKVHHIHHWADGGRTDLDNAALLCQRHHTHVHTRRLWAEVHDTPDDAGTYVHWNLSRDSYDRALDRINDRSPWAAA